VTADHYATAIAGLRAHIVQHGDAIQRDFDYSDATLKQILLPALDLAEKNQQNQHFAGVVAILKQSLPGVAVNQALEVLAAANGTTEVTSQNAVFRAIADARLGLFGRASAHVGVELPLTTLPDFHYEAFAAHKLAMGLVTSSMQAYVHQVQRPERGHYEAQKGTKQPYPFYKHQESTGTGVDARFGKALGSSDTKALEESTESDDLRDRAQLEAELAKKL
jgi:isocitrate lyase